MVSDLLVKAGGGSFVFETGTLQELAAKFIHNVSLVHKVSSAVFTVRCYTYCEILCVGLPDLSRPETVIGPVLCRGRVPEYSGEGRPDIVRAIHPTQPQ